MDKQQAYAFPPFCIIPRCLAKVQKEGTLKIITPAMAESTILPVITMITANVNPRSNIVATTSESATVTRGGGGVTPTDREQTLKLLAGNFKQSKQVQGLSNNTSQLLAAVWHKGHNQYTTAAGDTGVAGFLSL